MAFAPTTTAQVKRRAHFQCCLCKALGVEVHHVVPQAQGGSDEAANAAPLCPSCHETYGENPTKRKFIREARDLWYEICDKRYGAEPALLRDIHEQVKSSARTVNSIQRDLAKALKTFNIPGGRKTIQLPLSKRKGTSSPLSIRDLLILANSASERPQDQVEILCLRELWPLRDGLRSSYKAFKETFGEVTLRHMASYALDELQIPPTPYISEPDLERALGLLTIMVICFNALIAGELNARFNEKGEVQWRAKNGRRSPNRSFQPTAHGGG